MGLVDASPARTAAPTRRLRLEARERLTFLAFIAPNFLLFGLFAFWPLAFGVYLSLHDWNMIAPVRIFVGLENYQELLADKLFWRVLGNTAAFTAGSVAATTVLALAVALALDQPLRGRSAYRAAIFSPTVTTAAAVAIVWQFIFDPEYGLIRVVLGAAGLAAAIALVLFSCILTLTVVQQQVGRRWVHYG